MLRRNSKDRTPETVEIIHYILRNGNVTARVALAGVAEYGLLWKDAKIWQEAVVKAGADKDINVFGQDKVLEACRTFSFADVQPTYVSYPTRFAL